MLPPQRLAILGYDDAGIGPRERYLPGPPLSHADGKHVAADPPRAAAARAHVEAVIGGLALFGASILAAAIAVALAGMSGMRQLRKLVSGRGFRVVHLDGSPHVGVAEPQGSDPANVVQLDRSQYTEVR